jgi:tetratricopeptide (TPR) repeat protein
MSRRLATRTAAVLGAAACVFAGGLVATRGGDRPIAHAAPASPSPVRANVDPLTTVLGTAGQVAQLQHAVAVRPDDGDLNARLGLAYLQEARETADPSYYPKADALLERARRLEPTNFDAIVGLGSLALSRHDFHGALSLGQQAVRMTNGFSPAAKAIVGDAEIELGRYPAAFRTISELGAERPSLVAYARQSYALELQGDLRGAAALMGDAVSGGAGGGEGTQWTRVQHGTLLLKLGQLDAAQREFQHALTVLPHYARAEAGLGAVAVARGDLPGAERWYRQAADHLPLAEILVALGDVQTARGESAAAADSYALVRAEQTLFQSAGGNADLELALFDADHGDHAEAVRLGRIAVGERPSVYAHDALGWALYRSGDCRGALAEARRANRLGTADPMVAFHLGAIAACAGQRAEAIAALHRAQGRNPDFHPIYGPEAVRLLQRLEGPAA